MTSLTLTQGINSVTFDCNLVYGTDYYPQRLNQREVMTADGGEVVYDSGPTKIRGVLIAHGITKAKGIEIRSFIEDDLVFSLNTFTISAVTGVDLGKGEGVAVTGCRYDGGNQIQGVLTPVAPGGFNLNLPYRFLR